MSADNRALSYWFDSPLTFLHARVLQHQLRGILFVASRGCELTANGFVRIDLTSMPIPSGSTGVQFMVHYGTNLANIGWERRGSESCISLFLPVICSVVTRERVAPESAS